MVKLTQPHTGNQVRFHPADVAAVESYPGKGPFPGDPFAPEWIPAGANWRQYADGTIRTVTLADGTRLDLAATPAEWRVILAELAEVVGDRQGRLRRWVKRPLAVIVGADGAALTPTGEVLVEDGGASDGASDGAA